MPERLLGRYLSEDFGELTLVAPNGLDWTIPLWETSGRTSKISAGYFLWLRLSLPEGILCDGWLELRDNSMRGAFTNGRLTAQSTGALHPDLPLQSTILPRLTLEGQSQIVFGGLDLSLITELNLKGLIVIVRRPGRVNVSRPSDGYWHGGVTHSVVWRLTDLPQSNS